MNSRNYLVATLIVASIAAMQREARAELSRTTCVTAHRNGQDARDSGELTLAKAEFLMCSQKACPDVIRDDCAELADQLSKLQPTVSFIARDETGLDLPMTRVFVDGELVLSRLDMGTPTSLDPGKHSVRFVNGDREQTRTIVVHVGEKARMVLATFGPRPSAVATNDSLGRPLGAYLLTGLGLAGLVGGGVVAYLGVSAVPEGCSISTAECAVAPGHPDLRRASDGVATMNTGLAIAGAGAVVAVGGALWFYLGRSSQREGGERHAEVIPLVGTDRRGLAVTGAW